MSEPDTRRSVQITDFRPPDPRRPLSDVQDAIARLLAHGKSVRQIAVIIGEEDNPKSESTVDYHIEQIHKHLRLPEPDPEIVDDFSVREAVQAWAFWTYRKGAA